MTAEVIKFIPKSDICHDCYKKTATKLCDFSIGESGVTFYRGYSLFKNQGPKLITCDKLLCDNCSNKFHGMDLCKNHYQKLQEENND